MGLAALDKIASHLSTFGAMICYFLKIEAELHFENLSR
jgi:hypothetical protein